MVEEGHVQQGYESEVAHILQAYGEIMVRKSAQSSSAVSKNHAVASSRADLVEDALVDVIFQLKGTLDVKSKDVSRTVTGVRAFCCIFACNVRSKVLRAFVYFIRVM